MTVYHAACRQGAPQRRHRATTARATRTSRQRGELRLANAALGACPSCSAPMTELPRRQQQRLRSSRAALRAMGGGRDKDGDEDYQPVEMFWHGLAHKVHVLDALRKGL